MQYRQIWAKLKEEIETEEIIVITGPRQVGKTTTLKWLLEQIKSTNKIYLDVENVIDRELFEVKDYNQVVVELERRGLNVNKRLYVAVDEIQLLSGLPSVVKYLYDRYKIKFFLTGSSSFYIKNHFSESMAGRKVVYEIFPLSFQEFLNFKNVTYTLSDELDLTSPVSVQAYNMLSDYYDEYIEYGGLPKVVLATATNKKRQILEEIYSSYINLDVQVLGDFKSIKDVRDVIKLLAARVGSRLNVSEIAKITGLSRVTIDNYVEFLEKTYLIRMIPAYSSSTSVQTRSLKKPYFIDTGIANTNANLSSGAKLENTVCHQLSFYGDVTYYSARDGEIDFILNKDIALEVKETPIYKYYKALKIRGLNLGLTKHRLIGKNLPATFDDFLWGGLIR